MQLFYHFSFLKVYTYLRLSMSRTFVKTVKLIAQKLWKQLITQTCISYKLWAISRKVSKFRKAQICQKWFISFQKRRCFCNTNTKFETLCSNIMKEVDNTILSSCCRHFYTPGYKICRRVYRFRLSVRSFVRACVRASVRTSGNILR